MTSKPSHPADQQTPPENTPQRLRAAVEAAQLAFWELDVASDLIYLAPRWGQSSEPQTPAVWQPLQTLLAQIHPDDAPQVQQKLADFLQEKNTRYVAEMRLKTASGWIWIESTGLASQRDPAGKITRIIGTHADITARKAAQETLILAQARAEQASQAKSEFLANMSHEVRTPLNAIMGLTRLLLETPLNAQQSDYLRLMDSSATTLLAQLNDVLDLSKIEAGKLVFEQVRFDLTDWIEQSVSPLMAQAQAKGLQAHLDIAPGLPPSLMGDPGRLRQILSNLLSNAVKFTERGGIQIKVWPDPEQQDVEAGQLRILFQVRDSGIGMSQEQQHRIFDAFTQADSSTTRRFGGTGLGLTISQRLVQMMNGKIRVASQPDKGSVFRFSAVFSEAPDLLSELSMPAALEARSIAGTHVLLAEDHPINQLLMRKLLENLGCSCEVAANGQEAVARWRSGGIDLILMDVQMPVMGGEEATALIRREERGRYGHTPIVALTAHALAGDREKYLAAGMDAYASKPVSPEALAHAMHAALETRRPAAADLLPAFDLTQPQPVKAAPPMPAMPPASPAPPTLDLQRLLRFLGGDRQALREVAAAMREDVVQRLPRLQMAADTQDSVLACRHAHALKGGLSSAALDKGALLASALEQAARDGNWPLFRSLLAQLQDEARQIIATLNGVVAMPVAR